VPRPHEGRLRVPAATGRDPQIGESAHAAAPPRDATGPHHAAPHGVCKDFNGM